MTTLNHAVYLYIMTYPQNVANSPSTVANASWNALSTITLLASFCLLAMVLSPLAYSIVEAPSGRPPAEFIKEIHVVGERHSGTSSLGNTLKKCVNKKIAKVEARFFDSE